MVTTGCILGWIQDRSKLDPSYGTCLSHFEQRFRNFIGKNVPLNSMFIPNLKGVILITNPNNAFVFFGNSLQNLPYIFLFFDSPPKYGYSLITLFMAGQPNPPVEKGCISNMIVSSHLVGEFPLNHDYMGERVFIIISPRDFFPPPTPHLQPSPTTNPTKRRQATIKNGARKTQIRRRQGEICKAIHEAFGSKSDVGEGFSW